ncbi:MAG: glycosyltransferase family 4 protein [Armatimonadota bacterium]|nr:glycosyltransferase family 4 protein [Armatimonadota bacterium]
MTILLICHYFAPEPGAPQARLLELGRAWKSRGNHVKVVTCFPNHPTGIIPPRYAGKLWLKEYLDGIQVYRNWVYATPNEGVVKKTLGHITFMISSVLLSLFPSGRADVVVVSSPTFFSLFSAYLFSLVKRAPFVVEVRDLWPAALIELGVLTNPLAIRILEGLELWIYRRARLVVVVTESFKENLVARGVPEQKVSVVTNGVDLERYSPGHKAAWIEQELDCKGKTLVLYIGALGISQALETVIRAAHLLQDDPSIVFGIVGEGADKQRLLLLVEELNLTNVRFLPAQLKEQMCDFYRTADICLVPLRNVPLFRTFIPSKMFEIMACARPIIASLEGESAAILERSGGAMVIPPEDPVQLAKAVRTLASQPELCERLGQQGATFVAAHYSRTVLAERYEQLLKSLISGETKK